MVSIRVHGAFLYVIVDIIVNINHICRIESASDLIGDIADVTRYIDDEDEEYLTDFLLTSNETIIYMKDGTKYETEYSLQDITRALQSIYSISTSVRNERQFLRFGKTALVNVTHITCIEKDAIGYIFSMVDKSKYYVKLHVMNVPGEI